MSARDNVSSLAARRVREATLRPRTWEESEFGLDRLLAAKDEPITLILPAREVAATIGGIIAAVNPLRHAGLLDEVLVVDAGSRDATAAVARSHGASVIDESSLMSDFGPCAGKGDAMWRAASRASGDVLVFADADTLNFDSAYVTGLLGPMLLEPDIELVKGSFDRPFATGETTLPHQGGRVTELLARPLLNLHFPHLAFLEQPLAGEAAISRELFEQLSVPVGYGVEIAMAIDVAELAGAGSIGQVRLGSRQNRHQSLQALSGMAYEVLIAAERRISGLEGRARGDGRRGSARRIAPRGRSPGTSGRRSAASGSSALRLDDDLRRAVFLLLEHLVGGGRLVDRDLVRGEVGGAERVGVVGHQRHDLVDPALDVRLAHPDLDALVEHLEHRHRVDHAAVDAADRDRPAAADRVDAVSRAPPSGRSRPSR